MQCQENDCQGELVDGRCAACGVKSGDGKNAAGSAVITEPKFLAEGDDTLACQKLLAAADAIDFAGSDDYLAWRQRADLFLSAIRQLETREIAADEGIKLMSVPLRESALREAAEAALRNCAHFARTFDERVDLIDSANNVRQTTWF